MKRSAFGGGLGGVLSDLRHRRLFRGRESRRSGSGGSWGRGSGLGSLAGSSWTFACCLRLITSPIRPAITSNVPAIMSQCGSCSHSMAVLTISNLFFAFRPSSTRRR
jgi:hypothetical protein